jgi:hypothetical protein
MGRMSVHEAYEIGGLAEDYARLKEQVTGIEERVARAHRALVAAALSFADIVVQGDRLTLVETDEQSRYSDGLLQDLLSTRELIELFQEQTKLLSELDDVRVKLRGWLVHV